MMVLPPKFKSGDHLAVIAPSASITDCDDITIKRAYKFLKNKGLKIFEHPQCRINLGHTAGTVSERVDAIHELVKNKDVSVIMSFWGGHNTNQIIEHLDYDLIRRYPKIFIGYSDTSALLLAITKKSHVVTYMGPSVISFGKLKNVEIDNFSWNEFSSICGYPFITRNIKNSQEIFDCSVSNLDNRQFFNPGIKIYSHGNVTGKIVASNIQSLTSLIGTDFFPDIKDCVLFIEASEDESTAQIHQNLTQLKHCGVFDQISGLVIGRFCAGSGFNRNDSLDMLLEEIIDRKKLPIVYDVNFGHIDPIITIPNGLWCDINTKTKEIIFSRNYE